MSQQKQKTSISKPKTWNEMTERERMFMKDKHGLPLNNAVKGKSVKKYGALSQH